MGEHAQHRGPFIGPEWPPPILWDRRLELTQTVGSVRTIPSLYAWPVWPPPGQIVVVCWERASRQLVPCQQLRLSLVPRGGGQ